MKVTPKIGVHIKLRGNAPLDNMLEHVLHDMRNAMLNPSHQVYIGNFTMNIDTDFIAFDVDIVLWQPFANELAKKMWESIDLLLTYESIHFDISGITGYEGIDPII